VGEQKELRWGGVALKTDSEGLKEYVEYFERQTKIRKGEEPRNQRPMKLRSVRQLAKLPSLSTATASGTPHFFLLVLGDVPTEFAAEPNKDEVLEGEFRNLNFPPSTKKKTE